MQKDSYFILTGAMGSGKSTILKELEKFGAKVIQEPARAILAEQRAIEGTGVYDKDAKLFCELMLSRAIAQYKQHAYHQRPVIYDRGVADNIAYMDLFGFDSTHAKKAANKHRCNTTVFVTPSWEEIYQTDDERTMSFEQAAKFGDDVVKLYQDLGYEIVEVPKLAPKARAKFILKMIKEKSHL